MGRRKTDSAAQLAALRQAEAEFCRKDPVYFAENYCHIEDKDAPELVVPFVLWPGQKKALRSDSPTVVLVVQYEPAPSQPASPSAVGPP